MTKTKNMPVKPANVPAVKGVKLNEKEAATVAAVISETIEKPQDKPLQPGDVLAILAKREKALTEQGEKLRGLRKLREELDNLRAWDVDESEQAACITLDGNGMFTTHNGYVVTKTKEFIEEMFEQRIAQFEHELATAVI